MTLPALFQEGDRDPRPARRSMTNPGVSGRRANGHRRFNTLLGQTPYEDRG